MAFKVLVVTPDADERVRIGRWFDPIAGDELAIDLRFAPTLAAALALPDALADFLLLKPTLDELRADEPLDTLANLFQGKPIAVWAGGFPLAEAGRAALAAPAGMPLPAGAARTVPFSSPAQLVARCLGGPAAACFDNGDALAAMADGVVIVDGAGKVRYANAAADRLTASPAGAALGLPVGRLMTLRDPLDIHVIDNPLLRVLVERSSIRLPPGTVLVRNDGSRIVIQDACSPIFGAGGRVEGAIMVFHDITAAHRLQTQVEYLSRHDFLTGLPNRFAATQHLEAVLGSARALGQPLAAMYIDLDNFKWVNESLGHIAGDQLLVSVAARLRTCFRAGDFISRQGGDEFLVLMAPGTGADEAAATARRILHAVAAPHAVGDQQVPMGCSVGMAFFPADGVSGDTLLQYADTALHAAKAAGRNTFRVFDEAMLQGAIRRRLLETALRQALDEDAFELFYQPKVAMADGSLAGCEALLRWHHPAWGWVSPARAVHCAEQTGLIAELGRWVLRHALRQARRWQEQGYDAGTIAVNVSPLELRRPDFVDHVRDCLAEAGVAPGMLQIELTESALMHDAPAATEILHRLKALGVSLAIDDFGTGYSSLIYLADLPVDFLKVDKAFVHGIAGAGPRRQALLRAVLAVAVNLGLPAVAEGIETLDDAAFALDAGCTFGQGYYYSQALDADAFARFGRERCAGAPVMVDRAGRAMPAKDRLPG